MARQVTSRKLVAGYSPIQREARSDIAHGGPVRDWHAAIERAFEAQPVSAEVTASADWPRIAGRLIGYGTLVAGYSLMTWLILT